MFDPYHKWLGIPPREQPPNHYRLLGIDVFESDNEVINAAANRQMSYLQQRVTGIHGDLTQILLNEIAAARVCLLNQEKKGAYDSKLKAVAKTSPSNDSTGGERLFVQDRVELLRQAKKAFVKQDLEKVVEILEGKLVDSDDPRLQKLLNDAKTWIAKIQQLSQQLDLAWKKQDAEELTQIANEILRIQPSHTSAKEALLWADSVVQTVKPLSSVKPEKRSLYKEWILQKHFFLSTSIFVVVILLFSVFIYHHFAASEGKPESLGRNLSEVASVETADKQQEITKHTEVKLPSQLAELKPAIYNVEIDPPSASIIFQNDPATPNTGIITGSGKQRRIIFNQIPDGGYAFITATCDGYRPLSKWLSPKTGQSENLSIVLEKVDSTTFNVNSGLSTTDFTKSLASSTLFVMTCSLYHEINIRGNGYSVENHGATIVKGKVGNGFKYGDGNYLKISGHYPIAKQPRTISLWLRSARNWDWGHALVQGKNEKNEPIGIMLAGDKWQFYDDNGGLETGVKVDTSWHHHCLVYDGNFLTYYIDGDRVVIAAKSLNTASGPLVFGGCFGRDSSFDGEIDEFALFDRALRTSEVQRLYQMGSDGISLAAIPLNANLPNGRGRTDSIGAITTVGVNNTTTQRAGQSPNVRSGSGPDWRVAETVFRLGGNIELKSGDSATTHVNTDMLPYGPFTIEYINLFENKKVTDNDLVFLHGMFTLKKLNLAGTNITEAGLSHIEGLSGLEYLYLGGTPTTDKGLTHISNLTNLRLLGLIDTKVTNNGMQYLRKLINLEEVRLDGTKVSVNVVKQILPNCKIVKQR